MRADRDRGHVKEANWCGHLPWQEPSPFCFPLPFSHPALPPAVLWHEGAVAPERSGASWKIAVSLLPGGPLCGVLLLPHDFSLPIDVLV